MVKAKIIIENNKVIKEIPFDSNEQLREVMEEVNLQMKAFNFVPSPKIDKVEIVNQKVIITMDLIKGKTLYEIYGDDPKDIPDQYWKKIKSIITILYYNNIHYIDITPYNFIKFEDEIYVIDFGHAKEVKVNYFLKDFLFGCNEWNPDFK
jgi:tRNA A-37 threonylcarbamoyl transferase component Bud32